MKKVGLLLGFLAVIMLMTGVNKIVANRLLSDVNGYNSRLALAENSKKVNEALNSAKEDLYRDRNGYSNKDGDVSVPNPLNENVDSRITFQSFNLPIVDEPLFIRTDVGSILTQPFPHFEWEYDASMVTFDGDEYSYTGSTDGVELKLFRLFISDNYDEVLTNIYNLEYYETITGNSVPLPYLDGQVGILTKLKDNAVVGYSILNSSFDDWEYLSIFNLKGDRLVTVNKGNLEKTFRIEDTDIYEQVTGHLIEFNIETAQKFKIEFIGHRQVVVNTLFGQEVCDSRVSSFECELGTGTGSVELEIYGTDLFQLDIDYLKTVKE